MRVLVISDSFKGSLSSADANRAIAAGVLHGCPGATIACIPVADGGEGTVEALAAASGGVRRKTPVTGVFAGETVDATWALLDDSTAAIEMASCAGLPLAKGREDTGQATTYGVGELIATAFDEGAERVIVGAGGSATTDLGCGAAAALGTRFYDESGTSFVPTGDTLVNVAKIVPAPLGPGADLVVMCDIDNPLHGPEGAFSGPRRAPTRWGVERLDAGLRHAAEIIERDVGVSVAEIPGAGAAGGLAAGLMAFSGAALTPGIDALLEAVDFSGHAADADLIITGEGRIDRQSLSGKVPVGVARRSGGVPVVVLAGAVGDSIERIYDEGVTAVFPIAREPAELSRAMAATGENLEWAAENVVRLFYRA